MKVIFVVKDRVDDFIGSLLMMWTYPVLPRIGEQLSSRGVFEGEIIDDFNLSFSSFIVEKISWDKEKGEIFPKILVKQV